MPELTGKRGIRAFLKARIGQIVTTEDIREASGGQGSIWEKAKGIAR